MDSNLITLSDFRPQPTQALAQLLADAIADGKVTLIIGDLGPREQALGPVNATIASSRVPTAELAREGEIWTFTYQERRIRIRDNKGARYLAILLEHPGVEMHSLDLVAIEQGSARGPRARAAGVELRAIDDDAGPLLDAEAKRAYKIRRDDLRGALEEAEAFNDLERASRAREEIELLERQLAGAVGLGGRDRRACSNAERARVNVTRAVRGVVKRVATHDAALGHELEATIRTGMFCVHAPDPRARITWWVEHGR